MNRDIKAFIFDMDGVLLDTETICERTWIIAGKEFGIPEEESTVIFKKCIGTNKVDTSNILKENLASTVSAEEFMKRTSELFSQIETSEGIKLMPFARETLAHLKQKGYRLALASSTREPVVERQLRNAGLFSFFETVTTGDMVSHSKPDPEIYRVACRSLSLLPEKCAAVEDSPNGIKSAKSAGLFTVMVPDRIQPDCELSEKIDLLCKNLGRVRLIF
ncbi:HAD family hydrolase [Treponema sp.]|uniref:HAD family hydrolase n=1 Tax=Treponema sp. TaxID=166 RepID=UPI003F1274DE